MADETMREVRLLGPPAILADGQALHISRRKSIGIIAYLLITDGRVARDRLCGLFWPELPQPSARRALRTALAHVRKLLPGDVVGGNRDCVWVRPRLLQSDVTEFVALSDDETDLSGGSVGRVEHAALLYRGEFMTGFFLSGCPEFDTWQCSTAERLSHRQMRNLWALGRYHSDHDDPDRAIDAVQDIVVMDPTNEEAHRELMLLYFEAGDRLAATRQYGRCAAMLHAEFGIDPDPATTELIQRIHTAPPRPGRKPREPQIDPRIARESVTPVDAGIRVVSVLVAGPPADSTETYDQQAARCLFADVVEALGGWVGETTDERLLAAYGLTRTSEDDPERAVLAALRVRSRLEAEHVSFCCAVRTGVIVSGTHDAIRFTGPIVLAALRQHARTGGGRVTICDRTLRRVRRRVRIRPGETRETGDRPGPTYEVEGWLDQPLAPVDVSTPFVGREPELTQAVAILASACGADRRGTGGPAFGATILVSGPAGIGKSRLVAEVHDRLVNLGDQPFWLTVPCSERAQTSTYTALVPALRSLINQLVPAGTPDQLSVAVDVMAGSQIIPLSDSGTTLTCLRALLRVRFDSQTPVTDRVVTRDELQRSCIDTVKALLVCMLDRGPVVLQVEDLHWADPATMSLLGEISECLAARKLSIVTTFRSIDGSGHTVDTERMRRARPTTFLDIALGPMPDSDIRRILAGDDSKAPAGEDIGALLTRIGGNPFLARELSRSRIAQTTGADEPTTFPDLPITTTPQTTTNLPPDS